MSIERAKDLDAILKYCIDKRNKQVSVEEVKQELLTHQTDEYILSLYYTLADKEPKILYPKSGINKDSFYSNERTLAFLAQGGFTKLQEELEKENKRIEQQDIGLELSNKKQKWDLRFRYGALGFSVVNIIGTILTIIGTWITINDSLKSQQEKKDIESKLEKMQQRLNQIEKENLQTQKKRYLKY